MILGLTLIGADLRDMAHDVVDHCQQWVDGLTTGDIVALLIATTLLTWVWLALRAATRLGPVEISTVSHDDPPASPPEIEALTALLRERLARSGLSPQPAVPGGAPSTDLISAIAASDIPQVSWVVKLLDAIPRPKPAHYQVTATLLRLPAARATAGDLPRLRFWLQSNGAGTALLSTVSAKSDEAAVDRAVAEIFAHISHNAVHVFPAWARWNRVDALMPYIKGVGLVADEQLREAKALFKTAARLEPTNVLPRLQLANIKERDATTLAPNARVLKQASVLRRYLDLAMEHTELVEPRYRGSVLAAMLANALAAPEIEDETWRAVSKRLRLGPDIASRPATIAQLERLARRESEATYTLLKPWYMLISRQRLRYRYELRGYDRQQLKQTVRISRHCMALRRPNKQMKRAEEWLRRASVRILTLWLRRGFCGWQAFYNAGCFYALLPHAATSDDRARRLRKRAYRCLNTAMEEAGPRLSSTWMVADDPDLAVLRKINDPEWQLLEQRATGPGELRPTGAPSSPWLYPKARAVAWYSITTALFTAFVAICTITTSKPSTELIMVLIVILLLALPISFYRAKRAGREVAFDGPLPTP